MNENPNCPYCAVELYFDDHNNLDDDGDTIIAKAIGHCSKCGKYFKWEDVYTLHAFQNLNEHRKQGRILKNGEDIYY